MDESTTALELPGFRFHPTEEELLNFYLKNIVSGKKLSYDIIGFLNIYHHEPWDLPGLAKIGEREWYFFVGRERKHGNGGRPNRTTKRGFWKATGSDRKIFNLSEPKRVIGLKKTLVYYKGRAPRGSKTDWVMNEYRLPDKLGSSSSNKDIVLCKIYRKATSLKVLEQRAAMEEMMKKTDAYHSISPPLSPSMATTISFCSQPPCNLIEQISETHMAFAFKREDQQELLVLEEKHNNNNQTQQVIKGNSSSLQVAAAKISTDWTDQDPFWAQLCRSP